MATAAGAMAIEPIADPRANPDEDVDTQKIMERSWGFDARVDGTVTFEEYIYWAEIERADEKERNRQYLEKRGPLTPAKVLKGRFSHGVHHDERKEREKAAQESGDVDLKGAGVQPNEVTVTDEEWRIATRALKTTSWGTVFFLITTDILGWGSTPYVFDSTPWDPRLSDGPTDADSNPDMRSLPSVMALVLLSTSSSLLPLEPVATSCGRLTWPWTRPDILS